MSCLSITDFLHEVDLGLESFVELVSGHLETVLTRYKGQNEAGLCFNGFCLYVSIEYKSHSLLCLKKKDLFAECLIVMLEYLNSCAHWYFLSI